MFKRNSVMAFVLVFILGITSVLGGCQAKTEAKANSGVATFTLQHLSFYVHDAVYTSDENSMARKIVEAEGNLLPIGTKALDAYTEGFEDSEVQFWTGYDSAREFFESFGIIIGEEEYGSGWYKCELPEGWYIEYDDRPDSSRDESVQFCTEDGFTPFYIITEKDSNDRTASIRGLGQYYKKHFKKTCLF